MLRFKPCPSFVFLSPKKSLFYQSCNYVAKVRIIFELRKFFGNFFFDFLQFFSFSCKILSFSPGCRF